MINREWLIQNRDDSAEYGTNSLIVIIGLFWHYDFSMINIYSYTYSTVGNIQYMYKYVLSNEIL